MEVADAYKWLFHATLGGEHALHDLRAARAWLEREWASIGKPLAGEPEVVRLNPDGSMVRVNLRPHKARGGDPEMLFAVFVASAERFRPDRRRFVAAWSLLGERLRNGPIGRLSFARWREFDRLATSKGYPATHHSASYEFAYAPAYRVVLGTIWVASGGTNAR
jgi:hypothetical protein